MKDIQILLNVQWQNGEETFASKPDYLWKLMSARDQGCLLRRKPFLPNNKCQTTIRAMFGLLCDNFDKVSCYEHIFKPIITKCYRKMVIWNKRAFSAVFCILTQKISYIAVWISCRGKQMQFYSVLGIS